MAVADASLRMVGEGYAVHDDERVVGGVQGCRAADTDGGTGTRSAVAGDDLDARRLAAEEFIGVGDGAPVDLFRRDDGDRTGQVLFLDAAVADDDDFLHHLRVLLKGDDGDPGKFTGRERLALEADATDGDAGICALDSEPVMSVQVCGHSVHGSLFHDADSGKRLGRPVCDRAADGDVLRPERHG